MLRAIPKWPAKVDVPSLVKHLARKHYRVSKRTVQRDLLSLSDIFPLLSDERGVTYGWSWSADAPAFDLPTMDATTALSVRMIQQFLPLLMPPTVLDALEPQFRRAQSILKVGRAARLDRWSDLVRVVPREMPLLAPKINRDALRVIQQALLDGRQADVSYTPRGVERQAEKRYTVNPLGLVARGSLLYLVCTFWEYEDIRQLALHRVQGATITDVTAKRPADFDLDRYIESGAFEYRVGEEIVLKAIFNRDAAVHLDETALSEDQRIQTIDEGHVLVTATVSDSAQLQWWLFGLGDLVEVLEPESLRARTGETLVHAAERYALHVDRITSDEQVSEASKDP